MSIVNIKGVVSEAGRQLPSRQLVIVVEGSQRYAGSQPEDKYPVASPSTAVVAGLRRFAELSNDEAFDLFDQLFAPNPPPLRPMYAAGEISEEELLAIVQTVNLAIGERAAKNSRAVASAISRAAGFTRVGQAAATAEAAATPTTDSK